MEHTRIDQASATPWMPRARDLFDVETWTENRHRKNDKPRVASAEECKAYLLDIAARAGLPKLSQYDISGQTLTVGQVTRQGGGEYVDVLDWETLTTRREWVRREAEYEPGSYCVFMPGHNQRQTVTMETLDESGAVVSSRTLPIEPKKHGVVWDRATVREAVGKVAKPPRSRKKTAEPPVSAKIAVDTPHQGNNVSAPPIVGITDEAADVRRNDAAAPLAASDDVAAMLGALLDEVKSLRAEVAELRSALRPPAGAAKRPGNGVSISPHELALLNKRSRRLGRVDGQRARVARRLRDMRATLDREHALVDKLNDKIRALRADLANARRSRRIASLLYAPPTQCAGAVAAFVQ